MATTQAAEAEKNLHKSMTEKEQAEAGLSGTTAAPQRHGKTDMHTRYMDKDHVQILTYILSAACKQYHGASCDYSHDLRYFPSL